MTTASADISTFDFKPLWDISGPVPKLRIYNNSVAIVGTNLTWWFLASTASAIPFHTGLEATPDIAGLWNVYDIAEAIPQILGHMDWSGNDFSLTGFVKDSAGAVFSLTKTARICRPAGNSGANNYAAANLDVVTRCDKARLYVEDLTNYTYNGMAGASISKTIKLIYPPDPTGVVPAPQVLTDQNNGLMTLTQNGAGYMVILSTIYQYDYTDGSSVRVLYKFQKPFSVQCNVDLCPLICEIEKMEARYEKFGCDSDDRATMALINSKLNRAMLAKMQPLCGVDVAAIVEEIKTLGGFTCDCTCNEFSGTNQISGDGSQAVTCSAVLTCINDMLDGLDPSCMGISGVEWQSLNAAAKFQKIINVFCCANVADIQIV